MHERDGHTDTHTHTHTYRQTDTAWRHRPRLHSIARQTLLRAMTTKEKTDSRLSVLLAEMIGISLHAATRHGKIGLRGDLSPCTLLVASHSESGIRNTSMHSEPVCHPRLWCLGHLLTQATSTSAQLPVVSKLYIFEMSWNVWQCCYQPISQYEFRPIKWLLSPKSRVKIGLIPLPEASSPPLPPAAIKKHYIAKCSAYVKMHYINKKSPHVSPQRYSGV